MLNNMIMNIAMLGQSSEVEVAPIPIHTLNIILGVLMVMMLLSAIAMIVVVLKQSGNSGDIGALSGGSSDTFFGKNKSKSNEGRLKLATIIIAVIMMLLSITYFVLVMIG